MQEPVDVAAQTMGSFHLTRMSLRNLFRKPATKMYPVVPPTYTSRSKGQVANDIKGCILCNVCPSRCPTHAITVNKQDETWVIDRFACIQCLSCVRNCPTKCLTMEPEYAKPSREKSLVTVRKPELTPEEKLAKEAADREKADRIAQAMAAKAARDAAKAAEEGAGAEAEGEG